MIKLYYNLDNIKEIRTMIFKEKFDLQISYIYMEYQIFVESIRKKNQRGLYLY